MAIKNPQLTKPDAIMKRPQEQDNRLILQGAGMLASNLIENKKENILIGFREDVNQIVQDSSAGTIDPAPEELLLSEKDELVIGDFARRMNKVHAISLQGTGATARARALIEAETALREAQAQYPRLATQLRQEAALVLGEDPTGYALASLDAAQKAAAASAQKEWQDHVERGYELGIPRTMTPGSADWYRNFAQLEEKEAQRIRIENELARIEAISTYEGRAQAEGQMWLADPDGVFQTVSYPITQGLKVFANMTPAQRRSWIADGGAVEINGTMMTHAQFVGVMSEAMGELDMSLGGMTEELRDQVSPAIEALKTRFNMVMEFVSDPEKDVKAYEAMIARDNAGFELGMEANARYQLFLMERMAPYLEVLGSSVFPSLATKEREELVKALTDMARINFGDIFKANGYVERMIEERTDPATTGRGGNGRSPAINELLGDLSTLGRVINESEQAPAELANGLGKTLVGLLDTMRAENHPQLRENFLEVLTDENTVAALQKAAPFIEEEYTRKLSDYYYYNAQQVGDLVASVTRDPRGITIQQGENGRIRITVPALRGRENEVTNTRARKLEDALNRRMRVLATIDQLRDNAEEPDMARAFRKLASELPFVVLGSN